MIFVNKIKKNRQKISIQDLPWDIIQQIDEINKKFKKISIINENYEPGNVSSKRLVVKDISHCDYNLCKAIRDVNKKSYNCYTEYAIYPLFVFPKENQL